MANVRIELNSAGVRELLRSAEMAAICKSYADGIAARAGEGYASDTYMAQTRVIASAYTATQKAYDDNKKHNTLLKAVGA